MGTNTLAYFVPSSVTKKKRITTLTLEEALFELFYKQVEFSHRYLLGVLWPVLQNILRPQLLPYRNKLELLSLPFTLV